MKRNLLKIFIAIGFIIICLFFYAINSNFPNHNSSIDLTGSDSYWRASLNIQVGYRSELIIRTSKYEEFEVPSEISIEIIAKDKSVYSDNLKFIPDTNFKNSGKYTIHLESNKYLERNYRKLYLVIRFDDETSKIPLREKIVIEN